MNKIKLTPDYDAAFVPKQIAIINEGVEKLNTILSEQDAEIAALKAKLEEQSRYVDLVSRCDVIGGKTAQGDYWHVSWLDDAWQLTIQSGQSWEWGKKQTVNDLLEALAIIDATPSNSMELEATDED